MSNAIQNNIHNFPEILTTCRFYLELKLDGGQEPVDAYFLDCKGLKRTQEIIEVCEVTSLRWGSAGQTKGQIVRTKIPGNAKSTNLVLRRGLTRSDTLWKWFAAVQSGNWGKQRKDGSLSVYNQAGEVQARFTFLRAWPANYTLTDFSAGSTDLEIEELELAVEAFSRES